MISKTHRRIIAHLFRFAFLTALLLSTPFATAWAQNKTTNGATPLGVAPGAPAGSYALSGFESVNLYNGSLNFHLPLVNISGRGSAGYTMVMKIDRKWTVNKETGTPNKYEPTPNWWDIDEGEPILSVGKLQGRYGGSRDFNNAGSPCTGFIHNTTLTRLTFTAPDGTEYELRDEGTNGEPHHPTSSNCSSGGYNRGKLFVTADGSSATFVSHDDILDYVYDNPPDLLPTGYLFLRDGTRYEIVGGKVMVLRDRNGNKVTFNYSGSVLTSITDSINRVTTLSVTGSPSYTQIAIKGFGGTTRYIKIYRGAATLRSDFTARSYKNLFNNVLNNASDATYNPWGVTAVELPNGQQYQFQYNDYGELARVVVPTGGAIEYDYLPGLTDNSDGGVVSFTAEKHIYRRVAVRRVYPDGGTGTGYANKTTYSQPESSSSNDGYVIERQYDSTGEISRTDHYFYGSPRASLNQQPTDYAGWKDGREYQTKVFAADETTLLRQVDQTFEQRAAVSWWTGSSDAEPPNDPRLVSTVTTLADTNQVSKQTSINPSDSSDKGFDQHNNQTDVWEYDYGSGAPGSLLRHTHTAFVTSTSYTDRDDGPSLLGLPSQVSLYNASGVERARTSFEYDVYTGTSHHALIARSDITAMCDGSSTNCPDGPDFTDTGYGIRGNVTGTTQYLLNSSGTVTSSITAYAQYDVAGNLVKAIDARGYETTINFSDCFGAPNGDATTDSGASELGSLHSYAFATSVTNALSQTTYAKYDFYTGRPVDGQDANGTISSGYSDSDPLDRPTKIIRGVNGGTSVKSQTVFSYDDTNRVLTVTTDFDAFEDTTPIKSQTLYDKFGRVTEKRQYENATDYITVSQTYDGLGRNYQTSNPYRSGETVLWTTMAYDSIGRVTSVTTPDSAVVKTEYSGNRALVADQNSSDSTRRKRISKTDALGHLTDVWEVTASDSDTESISFPNWSSVTAGYRTSYEYDTLDNLTKVTQGSQSPREFTYDSLKHLSSASNPESGTISYQYDNNGNLEVKTDARGVSSHYAYDELNRVTRRWYNGSSSTSYTTNNSPSLPSGVAASDEVKYLYDAQTLPSGAPSTSSPDYYSRGSSVGRLVAVTYGSGSAGDYYGYDAAGRSVLKIQQTGGINYKTSATYNVGNALVTETYPSTRTVTNTYDGAGRTASVAGYLGDGTQRTYSTGITYSPFGGMTQEQFGTTTAIYNKLFYNSRGQLAEIREGLTGNDSSWRRGAIINFYSTCWGMCGGSTSNTAMTDNNGNLKSQQVFIPQVDDSTYDSHYDLLNESYTYDSLNRLQDVHDSTTWQQKYSYDRFGNRTIAQGSTDTFGTNIPKPNFEVQQSTNRLYGPGDIALADSSRSMQYDSAGNLKKDTYSGFAVTRAYDAENRMTSETQASSYVAGGYTYDGDGRRVKRVVNGVETWQVYGVGGELLAEYAQNGAASSPQKEYGYRNGQLLITGTPATDWGSAPTIHDNPLVANVTTVQARHITELRTAIDALRTHLGMSGYSWTTSATTSDWITADPILEMRTALNQALGAPTGGYATGLAQGQPVKAIHIQELRDRVLAAWSNGSSTAIHWLVTDQLGTPRMIFDQSGSLANTSRHDYLPFGEEIFAGTAGRTTGQGYANNDGARQKFTQKERDNETGLDYFGARYYGSAQGRFSSADPLMRSASIEDPQSFNRYNYVENNPTNDTDPDGLCPEGKKCQYEKDDKGKKVEYYEDEDGNRTYVTDTNAKKIKDTPPVVGAVITAPRTIIYRYEYKITFPRPSSGPAPAASAGGLSFFAKLLGAVGLILTTPKTLGGGDTCGGCCTCPTTMSDQPDTSANPDPEDNKPDTDLEPTPETSPKDFEPVRGTPAKRNKKTKEIWEKDRLHKDHYEVYKNRKRFDQGRRTRTVWSDGSPKS